MPEDTIPYTKIGWLEYFNQDSVQAGEIDMSTKENFVNRKGCKVLEGGMERTAV